MLDAPTRQRSPVLVTVVKARRGGRKT
jgi:hypothetical protein